MSSPPPQDYNPDTQKSASAIFAEGHLGSIVYVLEVKQLGVIVMRASRDERGKLAFNGISTFTNNEIQNG